MKDAGKKAPTSILKEGKESGGASPKSPARRKFLARAGRLAAVAPLASGILGAVSAAPAEAGQGPISGNSGVPTGPGRRLTAIGVRQHVVDDEVGRPFVSHPTNGDETSLPDFIGNFSKGMPHNNLGEVEPAAYQQLLTAMQSGLDSDFEAIPLGCPDPSHQRRFVDPQSGLSYDTEGPDSADIAMPPAPSFSSAETAGEMVELYWMALLRDVPFDQYATNPVALAACADLSALSEFRGPKQGGQVTPQTLFRENLLGALAGPYISQFLLLDVPYGAQGFSQALRSRTPGVEYGTNFDDWLDIQQGCGQNVGTFDPTLRFAHAGRDIASFVEIDALAQAYFNALIISMVPPNPVPTFGMNPGFGGLGVGFDPNNPYFGANPSRTQEGLGTFGPPYALSLMWEVANRAVRAQWYQKWAVHRRLRPEEFGGRVEVMAEGKAKYPIHPDVLNSSGLAATVSKFGTRLLPLAFPEGSPTHPSYGAGHATVAGACVTILKAILNASYVIPNPVAPSSDGTSLVPYTGPDAGSLSVGGELNKLAVNIAFGRGHAGIHWRSDNFLSFFVGEAVAIGVLEDQARAAHEPFQGYQLTKFDGTQIIVGANPSGTP